MAQLLPIIWSSQGETVRGCTYLGAKDKTMISSPILAMGSWGAYCGGKGRRPIPKLGRRDEEANS